MDDQACPRCKTTKYRNPSLKLMVNVCGHALCESCVDLLFLKGAGSCPDCNVPLRRCNFRVQLFEDPMVEKEVDIRRRVLRDFNKKEEDFSTLREYNDFLEDIESIVYNLTNNIDIVATNKKIEQYKKDNRETILKNKSKVSRDELEIERLIELEKTHEEIRRKELQRFQEEEKKKKIRAKEALIDELMFSSADARNILETFAQTAKEEVKVQAPVPKVSQFSSGIGFGMQQQLGFLPLPIVEEGEPFVYNPVEMDTDGPHPPIWRDIEMIGFVKNVRAETNQEKAGGYQANVACLRALQEALLGLYHVAERTQFGI